VVDNARGIVVKRWLPLVAVAVVAFTVGWVASKRSDVSRVNAPEHERAVFVNRPDPASPSGRSSVRLTVRRVVSGSEGTIEYEPIAYQTNEQGTTEMVITDRDWVVCIGQRCYLMTLRE